MLTPKIWLTKFVDLNGISDQEFADRMTFAGHKVETIHGQGENAVYEFEVTSNRPDTLSIIGLAREAAAIFNRKLRLPSGPKLPPLTKSPLGMTVSDQKLCPAVSSVEIANIKVKPSSPKIQKLLTLAGIRPVNNIVDATNFLMLETGQPMHAFDADKIKGKFTLRAGQKHEKIIPLDHIERILAGGEIIIEDEEKLVDLAGLMGGLNTEITDETNQVFLLVPVYDPVAIRRASKFLKLRTEASTRFEKKIDMTQTEAVAARAVELITKEASGKQSTPVVTRNSKWQPPLIHLEPKFVTKIVGREFSVEEIDVWLQLIAVSRTKSGYLPPPWRRDLETPVDLVEEIVRLYGFNRLPRTLPSGSIPVNSDSLVPNWDRLIREFLTQLGYTETYASTLIGEDAIRKFRLQPRGHLKVLHPMSRDYEYMRLTIVETMLPFIAQNLNTGFNLFELGTVFIPTNSADQLPPQPQELVLASNIRSFAQVKGDIETLGRHLNVALEMKPSDSPVNYLHPFRQGGICFKNKKLGSIGYLHPHILAPETEIMILGLNISGLKPNFKLGMKYPPRFQFQSIIEDITLVIPPQTLIGPIIETVRSSKLVSAAALKKQWQDTVTLAVEFNSDKKQLSQVEVNQEKNKIVLHLEKEFGVELKH